MNTSKSIQKEAALVATLAVTIGELIFIAVTPQGGSIAGLIAGFIAIAAGSAIVGILWFLVRSKLSKPGKAGLEEIDVRARVWLLLGGVAASAGAMIIGLIAPFYPLSVAAGLMLVAFIAYAAIRLRPPS